jgi:hypothetical protein
VSFRGWARRDETSLENKPGTGSATIPVHFDDVIDAIGISGGWRGKLARGLSVEARADGSVEGNEPGLTLDNANPAPRATRFSAGGGLDADWRVAEAWTLGASGRVDVDSDDVGGASSSNTMEGASGSDVRPTGHLGTEVELGPVVLAAHGGAVARPASFVELYGSPGGVLANPSLQGESAWTADAGARVATRRGPVGGQAELSVFGTWAHNLILFIPEGAAGYLKAENIGRARIYGLEASLGGAAFGFDVRAAYTGLATFDDDADAFGAPLPGRPAHDFVGDLGYSLGPVRIRYGIDAIAGLYADKGGMIPVPSRVLQGTGARLDVPGVRGLRIAFEIRNLLDVRTGTYPGLSGPETLPIGDQYNYPLPGRSFLVTARWTSSPELAP